MSNPFEDNKSPTDFAFSANPFDPVEVVSSATQAAKQSVMEEAGKILNVATSLNRSATLAWKNKNVSWLKKIGSFGEQLLGVVAEFIKRAIQLAVAKFVLELCAMIINQIMQTVVKASGGKMDITSPNVHYTSGSPAQATPVTQQNPYGNYRSPFDGGLYDQARSSVSPW